jgi:hypothetical protein
VSWRRVGNDRRFGPALVGLTLAAVLVLVVIVAWAQRDDDENAVDETTEADEQRDDAGDTDEEQAGEPTLRIQPQRARVGPPLELSTLGTGCGSRSATLSIVALGEPTDTPAQDRLVVRRRVDVEEDGTWSSSPLLVGQPVGTYRVTASCDRRAVLTGIELPAERRDVFVAAELLELTGPAVLYDLDVAPSEAAPGQAVTVRLSGHNQHQCPAGVRVMGNVFPTPGTIGSSRPFEALVDANGRWVATITIPARDANGSYGVEARCLGGFAYATESIRFLVPGDTAPPAVPVGPGTGTPVPPPAAAVPGQPTYTG